MLTLVPVDPDNWREPLTVREDQRRYVADRTTLLARAYAYRNYRSQARLIMLDGTPIGMLLYHDDAWENRAYVLSQFFIDQRWQRQGHGYAAMQLVLDGMRREGRFREATLCYVEGDEAARRLYEKCGFAPTGEVDGDEIVMRLTL